MLYKTIRLHEKTYDRLEALMHARETFNDVIDRLLNTWDKTGELIDTIEGSIRYREEQRDRIRQGAETH